MYSLILMTAMSSAPQGPEFGGYFRDLFNRGCSGCTGCSGCYGSCSGQGTGCYGSDRPPFGSRLRAFFSFGGGDCCGGCYGSCTGRSYACYGSSCCGGSGFGGYAAPLDYGLPGGYPAPAGEPLPYGGVPGAIPPPTLPPGAEAVPPFAPNRPAPVIDDRYSLRAQSPAAGGLVSASPNRATVVVRLPADAKLYAEGR